MLKKDAIFATETDFMKVLVTGAAGFIGSHTAERLKKLGYEVIGIDNFSPYYDLGLKKLNAKALSEKNIEVYNLDLRTDNLAAKLTNGFDYIFHFAAHPGISDKSTFCVLAKTKSKSIGNRPGDSWAISFRFAHQN